MYTVDASVWVNAVDQREPGHLVSRQFLEMVRDRAVPIIVPNLVLVEVAGAISRTHQAPVQAQAFAIALSRLPHQALASQRRRPARLGGPPCRCSVGETGTGVPAEVTAEVATSCGTGCGQRTRGTWGGQPTAIGSHDV